MRENGYHLRRLQQAERVGRRRERILLWRQALQPSPWRTIPDAIVEAANMATL